ncbi:MAG TPA: DUF1801 domain-containing protein, partial [Rhizobiaceae bacterium]|nr:DUF1801 domain-containing protein [Rhizobiaceae bacterium]
APAHASTLASARRLVESMHPDAFESASSREKSVWWGFGPHKNSEGYAYVIPHAAHVNLGFFQGAHLPDPGGLLEGTGKALRHVKLKTPDDLARQEIRDLFAAARDERRAALNIQGDDR